jgi:hypothetical protein
LLVPLRSKARSGERTLAQARVPPMARPIDRLIDWAMQPTVARVDPLLPAPRTEQAPSGARSVRAEPVMAPASRPDADLAPSPPQRTHWESNRAWGSALLAPTRGAAPFEAPPSSRRFDA